MKKCNILLLTLLLLQWSFTNAQNNFKSPILETYIELGVKNNLGAKRENISVKKAYEKLKQTKALFYPNISLNGSYSFAKGGRKIEIPTGDLLNPVYNYLNMIDGGDKFPQISNTSEALLPNNYHDSRITGVFNLLNTDLYYSYQAQKKYISIEKAKEEAFINVLKQKISVAYYTYLQSKEQLEILSLNKGTLKELKRVNEKLYNNGLRTKDILYDSDYELNLIESKIAEAHKNCILSQTYFNYLLDRDDDEIIEIDSVLLQLNISNWKNVIENEYTIADRAELQQLSRDIDLKKTLLSLEKKSLWVPKITLANNIGYQGFKYKFNQKQFFDYAQINFQWTLFSGGSKKSKIRNAKLEYAMAQNKYMDIKKQLELEKTNAIQEYNTAMQNYRTKESALCSIYESFSIARKKYEQNQIIWLELIKKQNQFLTAQLELSLMKYSVIISYVNLQKTLAKL